MDENQNQGFILDSMQLLSVSLEEIAESKNNLESLIGNKERGLVVSESDLKRCIKNMEIQNRKIDDILSTVSFYALKIKYTESDFN